MFGGCRFPGAVVVGDDEVAAAAGADVFGPAGEQAGRKVGADAEAVRPAALQPRRQFFERGKWLGVNAGVEGGNVADEGAQDRLPAAGAELGAGPVGEGCG
jgi:hypothetical protein